MPPVPFLVNSKHRFGLIVCCLATTVIRSTSSEVWVSVGDRLESESDQLLAVPGAAYLTGVSSYRTHGADDTGVVFLVTDTNKRGAALYRLADKNVTKVYEDDETSFFESVVYSTPTKSIYLTSPATHSIIRLTDSGDVTVVNLKPLKPSGLAIDPCTRIVYWTSTAPGHGKVLSFKDEENSGDLQKNIRQSSVVVSDLTKPRGLAVDPHTGQVYWTDQKRSKFSIFRGGMDGQVETLLKEERGEPFSIAISDSKVFWSDWSRAATYSIDKDQAHQRPELLQSFRSSKPNGLTYVPNQAVHCAGRHSAAVLLPTTQTESPSGSSSASPTTTSSPIIIATTEDSLSSWCLNGVIDRRGNTCFCEDGWTGDRCQISLCHNYCLGHGSVCTILEDHPVCFCADNHHGDRCEFHANVEPVVSIRLLNLALYTLPAILLLQFIVIAVLATLVHRYRKRPRVVRKRFISTSKSTKVTEVKTNSCSGGSRMADDDGIQIDIEDCCNMAMCDTPCFDPPSRLPKEAYLSKLSPSKKNLQDKQSLLDDNIDENLDF